MAEERNLGLAMAAAALTLFSLPEGALANTAFTTDCWGTLMPKTLFAPGDDVCISGDVDFACPGMVSLPGADVYVTLTGEALLDATPVHFDTFGGGGSFIDVTVMTAPLPCGTYDLLMDEHCDGVISGDDIQLSMAFTVDDPSCTADAGTPDAGTPDAGTPDAGTPDAGIQDAGATTDAGSTIDAGTTRHGGGGCSTAISPASSNAAWPLGLGLLLSFCLTCLTRRRARSRLER